MTTLTIKNSCEVSKRDFNEYLFAAYHNNESEVLRNRHWFFLKMEWATHNALYALGLWRDHTRDVDFEYPQNPWMTIAYVICGLVVWPFIR